jgi:hypothetical protein
MARTSLRVLLLVIILVNVSYVRGFSLPGGLTTTYLIILWLLAGLAIIVVRLVDTGTIVVTSRWWLWIGLITWIFVSFLYNIFVRPDPAVAILFVAELGLNVLLFVSVVFLLDRDAMVSVYRGFVGVSAVSAALLAAFPFFVGFERVRRVGGYRFPGAVNNISQMIAVAMLFAIAGLVCADNWREKRLELAALPALSAALFLTGSRAAILGLLAALVLLSVVHDYKMIRIWLVVAGAFLVGFIVLSQVYNLVGLYRFNIDSLKIAIDNRLFNYTEAIHDAGFSLANILFGGGMYRYSPLANTDVATIIYPHNYVISFYVHVGLPAAILFTIILLKNGQSLLYWTLFDDEMLDYVILSTLLALIVVVMYSFTSGRLTRTFPIWIVLGASEYLYAARELHNDESASFGETLIESVSSD